MRLRPIALMGASLAIAFPGTALGLSQPAGSAGCFSSDGSDPANEASGACQVATGMTASVEGATVSPDSRNAYAASWGGIASFSRTPGSATLAYMGNTPVSSGVSFVSALAVSPDGRNVYAVAGSDGGKLVTFARDPGSGALSETGCVSEKGEGAGCADGAALADPVDVAVSPDGKNVYALGSGPTHGLAIFDRNTTTGALTQKPGAAGCFTEDGFDFATSGETVVCGVGRALVGAAALSVDPSGQNLYVAAEGSSAVAVLDRDAGTGALSQDSGAAGCVSEDGTAFEGGASGECAVGRALDGAQSLAISPEGANLYVASDDDVAILGRSVSGALSQSGGPAGCVSEDGSEAGSGTAGECGEARAIPSPEAVAVSPDGATVFVASDGFSLSGENGSVAVLSRNAGAGTLSQAGGTAGCVSETGADPGDFEEAQGSCAAGRALAAPSAIAVSPDGAGTYVTSSNFFAETAAVAIFGPGAGGNSGAGGKTGAGSSGKKFQNVHAGTGAGIKLGKLDLNRRRGTATLTVTVSGAGKVTLSGKGVAKSSRTARGKSAHRLKLAIRAKGKAAKKLRTQGKARLKVKATFAAAGGEHASASRSVTLKKRLSSR